MSTPTTEIPGSPELELEGQSVGEYVVEGRLGRGAFGTVYKGIHPLIGKAVAIKVLSRRFSADPEIVSRFVAEARAVNQIRHRHIIDIFSFGQLEDGRHYYVMEYLAGETLQALLEREHRIPLARCFPILRAIGRALDAAHAKGIAHRDLKAENIFLGIDSDGEVWPKLLDFGIAKLIHPEDGLTHKTRSGMSIGTPLYMSPEQCHGRQIDHRTDIYAFGILVYLMLTGVFPLDGDSYMEILMKQVGSPVTPPSVHVAELPEAIDDVVLWLVHKDPALRPPDLRTAVTALEQAAARAGLLALAAPTRGWDVTSDALVTQPAAIVVPRSSSAPRSGASTGAPPPAAHPGRAAPTLGSSARRPGRPGATIGGSTTDATGASRHAGKTPIIAVASLVAITVIVAAAVALYPRTDGAPADPATRRAQPSAAVGPGHGPPQLQLVGAEGTGQRPPQEGPGQRQTQGELGTMQPQAGHPLRPVHGQHGRPSGQVPPSVARQPPGRGKRTTKDDIIDVFGGDHP